MSDTGTVFHIQRFSIHDGPGIRTTVFLKGCALGCFWCHNPEGRRPYPEIQYFADRCLACGACVAACQYSAHEMRDGLHVFLRERCESSGKCVETCYSQALQLNGRFMTVEQVMEEVLRDTAFYETSGGGVTLSGGEPTLSSDFPRRILKQCKDHGLHTAIETCGESPWASFETLLPVTDLIMMDIKHVAPDKHRAATGKSNDRILANARRLALTDKPIVFRTPVVPSVNDTGEEIGQIASFIRDLKDQRKTNGNGRGETADIRYELLAFHKLASDKYTSLGLDYKASGIETPTGAKMSELLRVAKRCGIEARIQ